MSHKITFFLFALSVFFHCEDASATAPRVLIAPFETHGAKDISAFRKEAMEEISSSLKKQGAELVGLDVLKELYEKGVKSFDEELALSIAEKSGADFAVLGSISEIGGVMSADLKVFDVKEKALFALYHRSAASGEELLAAIGGLAPEAVEKMLSGIRERPAIKEGAVAAISVFGVKRLSKEAVLKKISSKTGEPFSPETVRDDIHAIYSLGYVDDISVDIRESPAGLELSFFIREKPFVKDVELSGNKHLGQERIREVVSTKNNAVLNRATVKEDAERIKMLYARSGYYLAEVTPEFRTVDIDVTVVFNIKEGDEVRVKRITIIGNEAFSDRTIKGLMETKEAWFLSPVTGSGSFEEFTFEGDLSRIIKHYYDRGFIKASVLDYRALLGQDKKWFYLTIALSEGKKYTVASMDVSGDILHTREFLLEKMKISAGEVFSKAKLAKAMEVLGEIYGEKGYANAEFVPSTKMDEEKNTVDLTINIRKNEEVYVERIDIRGNVRTRDKVIRREFEFQEGDLFSTSGLKKTRNNLRRLGYFEEVRITRTPGTTPQRVELNTEVKERPTGAITFGVGYSSVDKLMATASVSQSNFMGTGLKLNLSGNLSSNSSLYEIGFTEPWLFDRPLSAGFDLFKTTRKYTDFDMDKSGFSLRFGFPVYKRNTYLHLTYGYENVDISNVSATASSVIKEQEGETTVSSVKTLLKHDTRDDIFFPTEGVLATASVEAAGGPLGGETNYLKYEGSLTKFFPLPWQTALSIRGVAGYVHSFDDEKVPVFERYFLGGINSLRGFESRKVSPEDPLTGELIGGESMVTVNTEWVFPLLEKEGLRGVVFFDAGNAYDGGFDFGDIRTGAGAGIRWYSPIGPIRLEWGYNLNRREDERQSLWEFTIGGFF